MIGAESTTGWLDPGTGATDGVGTMPCTEGGSVKMRGRLRVLCSILVPPHTQTSGARCESINKRHANNNMSSYCICQKSTAVPSLKNLFTLTFEVHVRQVGTHAELVWSLLFKGLIISRASQVQRKLIYR